MLNLAGTSDLLQVTTDTGSVDIECHASYVDYTASSNSYAPSRNNASHIATATTATIVGSPASGVVRNVRFVSVRNNGTVACGVTITHTDGTTAIELWQGTLQVNEGVIFCDAGWIRISNGGAPVSAISIGPPDVQTFSTSGTWTKPTTFVGKVTVVKLYGAGGGGGAGASLATATVAKGGGGGGGGACAEDRYLTADLPSTVSVTVPVGGTAGAPGVAGAAGGNGGNGSNTTFGSILTAFGGGGGAGGAISGVATGGGGGGGTGSVGTAGSSSVGQGGNPGVSGAKGVTGVLGGTGSDGTVTVVTTHNAEYGGAGGGGSTVTPTTSVGGGSLYGGAGGGSGGCHNATPAIVAGQKGGLAGTYTAGTGANVGTDGASPTAGSNGADGNSTIGGGGGGGGGTTVTASTNGAAGGNGGKCGGGGGGGGVGMNPGLGGAGGAGGAGYAVVITW